MFILDATQSSISSPWLCFFTLPALAQIVNLPKIEYEDAPITRNPATAAYPTDT